MGKSDFSLEYRKRQKEIWFKLAKSYLMMSDNEFLRQFSKFIEEGYSKKAEFIFDAPEWATPYQTMIKDAFDFEVLRLSSMQNKGFALIGKTDFDKLEFITKYFLVCGISEFTGGDAGSRYAVIDCSDIKGRNGLLEALVKTQNVSYVVFNNCGSLLKHDSALRTFKHLLDGYFGLTLITKDNKTVVLKTNSSFIFLGEENTLRIAVEKQALKGDDAGAYNRMDAFVHHIHVYDFDKGERYRGQDVTPVWGLNKYFLKGECNYEGNR
jgi:hypothetical protein